MSERRRDGEDDDNDDDEDDDGEDDGSDRQLIFLHGTAHVSVGTVEQCCEYQSLWVCNCLFTHTHTRARALDQSRSEADRKQQVGLWLLLLTDEARCVTQKSEFVFPDLFCHFKEQR